MTRRDAFVIIPKIARYERRPFSVLANELWTEHEICESDGYRFKELISKGWTEQARYDGHGVQIYAS